MYTFLRDILPVAISRPPSSLCEGSTGNKLYGNFIYLDEYKMSTTFDIIIVGGGPIGIACGLEAQKAGLSFLILEKGCLVNSLYNYPANMTFFSTSERIEIGGIPFVSNHVKPHRGEALEYYRRVAVSNGLPIHLQ